MSDSGCHFAIYSESATAIQLCLFDSDGREQPVPMKYRHGGLWYTHVEGIVEGQAYGYRVDQPAGKVGNANKLLLDPYAKALTGPVTWYEEFLWQHDWEQVDSARYLPKAIVKSIPALDTGPVSLPPQDRIIYELHVKGFTQQHPEIPLEHRGKYLGLGHPQVIRYLQSLGVTSIQLMPCFSFMDEARLISLGLVNYWGYNPINFFTPDWRYALKDPVAEFQWMVQQLHQAGFEVILDVVYNHTAEGGLNEGMLSFKGIDSSYYRMEADTSHQTDIEQSGQNPQSPQAKYQNFSGCGNSLQTEHPMVLQLVMDSLRHWVTAFGIDGFRFDLAASLMRQGESISKNTPLLQAIAQDPALRDRVLIAEPWDLGPNGYQLGTFPREWLEVNDHYRDFVRGFWKADPVGVAGLSTRLMGSRDIFNKMNRSHACSVNHVTYHDGFTLQDLVSYRRRHNAANGEQGSDGHSHNLSCNHGVEGDTDDPEILKQRERHRRNLLMTLLISRGTPHLLAGDEFGNSQQGNNNAYCQDNPTSWLDWGLLESRTSLVHFVSQLIRIRQSLFTLNDLQLPDEAFHEVFFSDGRDSDTLEINDQLCWLDQYGKPMEDAQWHNPDQRFIALLIQRTADGQRDAWLLAVNGSEDSVEFAPHDCQGIRWEQVIASSSHGEDYGEEYDEKPEKSDDENDEKKSDGIDGSADIRSRIFVESFSVSLWRQEGLPNPVNKR
ncbi:glycogen debranching enzyme GlgX [Hahella sp. CCB-MM4]|nr:glycogen debranching enzyme GlgX [Hahella sp. CCB-MM4]